MVVVCRSVADVVRSLEYAAASGDQLVPRGGGHCFAGRSSTTGIVLDTSGLDAISVDARGVATIGAGARLVQVYAALAAHGRTLPAGCGPTVGIAGLTLGGGIGLLGRQHGLTCDRLVSAQVVLANGEVVECDAATEADLFWALRGAGGGQFGVVTTLRFDTVAEPVTTRIEATWSGTGEGLVTAWQRWAPAAPDGLTVNLAIASEAGAPTQFRLFGTTTLERRPTLDLLRELTELAGLPPDVELRPGLPFHEMKQTFADTAPGDPRGRAVRHRSEFFSRAMSEGTVASLLTQLAEPREIGRRELAFTAMGGAYNRVREDATAFAHRTATFLLEHVADAGDPWVDTSWETAHVEGSGRVYANFPDPALDTWSAAYHADNHPRLAAVKLAYDPDRFFDFPQAV